jgi:hypothetical protein
MDDLEMYGVKSAWIKTWRGIEVVRVVKESQLYITVIHNRMTIRFLKSTMQEGEALLIMNLDKYKLEEKAKEQWEKLKFPGLDKFNQIKALLGDDFKLEK